MARSPDHPQAFTRARKLPLPTLLVALLSFRGASVQSELDAFFASLRTHGSALLVSDRALAKARSKRFCCNKDGRLTKGPLRIRRSEGQAVELVCCGHSLAIGAAQLPLLDHVHGLNACNDDSRTPE